MAQTSQDDRSYVQAFLEDNLSDAGREVRITGFEGALSSRATIKELTIADADGVWLTLRDVVLDWSRTALLRGRLEIGELSARELLLPRMPAATAATQDAPGIELPDLPTPEAKPFSLPELPVSISVAKVAIGKVSLGAPLFGEAAIVSLGGSVQLDGGEGRAGLEIKRIDGATGTLRLNGAFSNASRNLDLSLILAEAANGIAANLIGLPGRPSVDLRIAGSGLISAYTATIGLDTDGVRRLGGEVTLRTPDGTAANPDRQFSANIGGDVRPLVLPQYRTFFGPDIRLDLRGTRPGDGGVNIDTLALNSAALDLSGLVNLGPDYWPMRIDLAGRVASADGTDVLLSLPGPETRVRDASFQARYDADKGNDWALELTVAGFHRDTISMANLVLDGTGQLTQGNGVAIGRANGAFDLTLNGLLVNDPALARAVGPSLTGGLSFDLAEGEPLALPSLALNAEDFTVSGALVVQGLQDIANLALSGKIALNADDLSRFSDLSGLTLGGSAKLDIAGQASVLGGGFDLTIGGTARDLGVGIAQLDPLIAGNSTLELAARRDGSGTTLKRLEIASPVARISGTATLASTSSTGRFEAQLANAGLIDSNLSGPASLTGDFGQTGTDWTVAMQARGDGQAVATLDGTAVVRNGTVETVSGKASLTAADLSPYSGLAGRSLGGGLGITAEGAADLLTGSFNATLDGAGLDLIAGQADINTLLRGKSKFATVLRREAGGIVVIDKLDLATGQILADVTGSYSTAKSRLRFNLDLRDIAVFTPDFSGPVAAEGVVSSTGADWTVNSRMTGPGGIQATVAGQVAPNASRADLTISGTGPLALANRFITPNLLTGTAGFDLTLAGPLTLNSLSGTMRTDDASLSLPGLKIALGQLSASAVLGGGQVQLDAASTVSSGGRLTIAGPITLAAPFMADLSADLIEVGVSEPGVYQTTVDGGIGIRGALKGGATISGALLLGRVEIRVPDAIGSGVAALPGLIHENEPAAVRQTRVRAGLVATGGPDRTAAAYPLDLTIAAPTRIFIRGRGLDGELGGSLRLRGTTANVIPDGRFSLIRGRLDILGKRLTLTEASAQIQGDFDPYLRVVAGTSNNGTTIQIVIEGLVSELKVIISSTPALPEDEILARLLFGREIKQISALQALQIAAAVNTLAGNGGEGILGRLRANFGLDDLDVSTSENGETGVRVGKYITEKIYSDVTVNSAGRSEINLNLSVRPSVTARGTLRSDGYSGLGLFFEKDY